jgi:hypothetical protein
LKRHIDKYLKKHPGMVGAPQTWRACNIIHTAKVTWMLAGSTVKEALQHVMKYKVPQDVAGSPSWHRKQFNDLLAMVRHFGMPSMFLTLTAADKAPHGLQWQEVSIGMMGLCGGLAGSAIAIAVSWFVCRCWTWRRCCSNS